jgi:AraC family cel operon transcriptional repressor
MRRRWKELVKPGHAFHVSAALDERRMPVPVHDHDFAEVTWVREGQGIHRINGRRQKLRTGQMTFIRPTDCHGLEAKPGTAFRLENVAMPVAALKRFLARYPAAERSALPWERKGRYPATISLGAEQCSKLEVEMQWLRTAPRNAFSLDGFLLNLARILGSGPAATSTLPEWLDNGLRRFASEAAMSDGVARLFRLAGRCPEHVARTMKKHLDITPTDWVNNRRIKHAARLTESTMLPIIEIAAECGFENLGYFHRLFRARFGTSPLRYRSEHRAVM